MSQEQIRRQIYRVFDPIEALLPDDPRYVECNEVRGSTGLLKILEDSIRLSDRRTCQLLSGPRGCGKTTELFRLRHLLTQDPAYFVIYCESDDYIDLNDTVEYPEVLLAVVQQLWQEADRKVSTWQQGDSRPSWKISGISCPLWCNPKTPS